MAPWRWDRMGHGEMVRSIAAPGRGGSAGVRPWWLGDRPCSWGGDRRDFPGGYGGAGRRTQSVGKRLSGVGISCAGLTEEVFRSCPAPLPRDRSLIYHLVRRVRWDEELPS